MSNINIDKNVYILGAGFSKEIGLPLQDDFLLVAKDVFFKNPVLCKHFEKVFEYQDKLSKMRKFLNYPLLNLEHLFNLIEMDIFYSKSSEIESVKECFTKLICDVLVEKTPNPFQHSDTGKLLANRSAFQNYQAFLDLFVNEQNTTRNDTIITFNYDLVLEGAACMRNWWINQKNYSLAPPPPYTKFNTSFGKNNIVFGDIRNHFTKGNEQIFLNNDIFDESDNSIKLLKLHGSINWEDSNGKTFIVPPTWNKSDQQVRKLWALAYEEIVLAKRIVVLGYSFPETDIYVKSLLALALNENKILQNIFFINPDGGVARNASLSMLDKHFEKYCDYKKWTFSEFIASEEGKQFIQDSLSRKVTL